MAYTLPEIATVLGRAIAKDLKFFGSQCVVSWHTNQLEVRNVISRWSGFAHAPSSINDAYSSSTLVEWLQDVRRVVSSRLMKAAVENNSEGGLDAIIASIVVGLGGTNQSAAQTLSTLRAELASGAQYVGKSARHNLRGTLFRKYQKEAAEFVAAIAPGREILGSDTNVMTVSSPLYPAEQRVLFDSYYWIFNDLTNSYVDIHFPEPDGVMYVAQIAVPNGEAFTVTPSNPTMIQSNAKIDPKVGQYIYAKVYGAGSLRIEKNALGTWVNGGSYGLKFTLSGRADVGQFGSADNQAVAEFEALRMPGSWALEGILAADTQTLGALLQAVGLAPAQSFLLADPSFIFGLSRTRYAVWYQFASMLMIGWSLSDALFVGIDKELQL